MKPGLKTNPSASIIESVFIGFKSPILIMVLPSIRTEVTILSEPVPSISIAFLIRRVLGTSCLH